MVLLSSNSTANALIGGSVIVMFISLLLSVLLIASVCVIFNKAGKPWWAIFIPFYGNYCQFDISFGNGWMFLLMFVPLVNIVIVFAVMYKLAGVFGKGAGFGIGLIFLPIIFLPILAFGDAQYIGVNRQNISFYQ